MPVSFYILLFQLLCCCIGIRAYYKDELGLFDSEGWGGERLKIVSKEHALDVIKGIEKAIELGWFK